ncbi:MAG: SPASM domain-containing protein [Planctomycetes bacterium]|nr:SPASM domain-containing protein [Planctomycetota bacterium]
MTLTPTDPSLLDRLPPELAALPFGSPEFKAMNARIAQADEDRCAPVSRAMPTWINLTGTTVCNLKCFMCNQFLDPNSPKWFMSDEVYERVVAELYPFVQTVQFSAFGEPLMTPKMEQKLDDLRRTNTKLEIVTNATLMMRESRFREKLLEALELVTFSVDGATRDTYNSVRTGADFDEVMDNIRRFADRRREMPAAARPRMNFNFIMMKRTVAEAPRFVEIVHELGGDEIVFNHLVEFHPTLRDESLANHRAYANEWMDRTREVAAALGVRVNMPPNFVDTSSRASPPVDTSASADAARPQPRPCGKPPIKCWFLWKRAYITHEGNVVPCCLAGIPHFGNMLDAGFFAVWNNETYRTYRSKVFTDEPHGPCRTCYLIYPNPELAGSEGYERF